MEFDWFGHHPAFQCNNGDEGFHSEPLQPATVSTNFAIKRVHPFKHCKSEKCVPVTRPLVPFVRILFSLYSSVKVFKKVSYMSYFLLVNIKSLRIILISPEDRG